MHAHSVVVLLEAGQLDPPTQFDAGLPGTVGEQPLQRGLRYEAHVTGRTGVVEGRVRRVQQARFQPDPGEVPGELRGRRGAAVLAARPLELPEPLHRLPLHLRQGGQESPPVEGHRGGGVDGTRLDRLVHLGQTLDEQHAGTAES